eukprot:TRINITY_DN12000_c0_g1_i1.p1 TRINITY_DN12000_c0_g1~~TRINITY_DN12000_c0_g1_i1.p1  ORF type:complete len:405 (+),score=72.31 TRINITY_DN12000_c0_g1_i1:45-1217(+)
MGYSSLPHTYSTLNSNFMIGFDDFTWHIFDHYTHKSGNEEKLYSMQACNAKLSENKKDLLIGGKIIETKGIEIGQGGSGQYWAISKDQTEIFFFGNQQGVEIQKEYEFDPSIFQSFFSMETKVIGVGVGYYYTMILFENGRVFSSGQENQETNKQDLGNWREVDCPPMKNITCGSNHTVGVSRQGDLVAWGCRLQNLIGNSNPGLIDVGFDHEWYNTSSGGLFFIGVSNKGIYFFDLNENSPMEFCKRRKKKYEKSEKGIYLISTISPEEIRRIHSTYYKAVIIPKTLDPFVISSSSSYREHNEFEIFDDLKKLCNTKNSKLLFPVSPTGRSFLVWKKENHVHWSHSFRAKVFQSLITFKIVNTHNLIGVRPIPKVLLFEIIKFVSVGSY